MCTHGTISSHKVAVSNSKEDGHWWMTKREEKKENIRRWVNMHTNMVRVEIDHSYMCLRVINQ
jgi:hypothetical protein